MTVNVGTPKWFNNQIIEDDPVLLYEGDVVTVVGTHHTRRNRYKIVDTPYGNQALLLESLQVLPLKSPDKVD